MAEDAVDGEAVAPATFGDRLRAAVEASGPLCAGIDPSSDLLAGWGLADTADGVAELAARCLEAFAGEVPVVKPQVAFFERHGAAGMAVLERLLADARSAGLLVIADAKRGDIGSTSAAYADAWLGESSPLAADAVTAHPYLGLGALAPFVEAAERNRRGVFVVVRGSNPEGRALQEATTAAGRSVEDSLLSAIGELNDRHRSAGRLGNVGAVVGATLAPSSTPLSDVGGPLLAPGVGAQGAGAAELAALFGTCPPGSVVANVSRSVLTAGPAVTDLRAAVRRARDDVASALRGTR
ncbi:MAG: orotidine-5'-phosphate decarboxylase [Acidimicrobiales bacterium]